MRSFIILLTLVWALPAQAQMFNWPGSRVKGTYRSTMPTSPAQSNYYKGPLEYGRWCNKGSCGMCNGIEAHNRALGLRWPRTQSVTVAPATSTASSSAVPAGMKLETYQVKVCVGGKCHYENRTRLVRMTQAELAAQAPAKAATTDPVQELTPIPIVESMLGIASLEPGQVLYDLGCGDGRVMERAIKDYGAQAVGVEMDPIMYDKAKRRLGGLKKGWALRLCDATKYPLDGADVVTIYQFPPLLEQMRWDTLKPGARVVSRNHEIPGLDCTEYKCEVDGQEESFFVHVVPEPSPWEDFATLRSVDSFVPSADWGL